MTDPIADYLTRIRNAVNAGHKIVEIPASKVKTELTRILHEKGYILSYKIEEGKPSNTIKIALKSVSYTHLRAHETVLDLVCRLLLEKKKHNNNKNAKSDS